MIISAQIERLMRRLPIALAIVLCGCANSAPVCSIGLAAMNRVELFFGGSFTTEQWQEFVDQEITPRFPGGFTMFETQGQWRDRDGIISRETGHELLAVVSTEPDVQTRLNAIRSAYERRFMQESVLLVESPVCAAF